MTNLSNLNLDELTLENFKEKTGQRFRVSKEQKLLIEAGKLTREKAFADFVSTLKTEQAKVTPLVDATNKTN